MEQQPAVSENFFEVLGAVLECPDGITGDAAMKVKHHDVSGLLASTTRDVVEVIGRDETLEVKGKLEQYVRSLLLPFLTFLLHQKDRVEGENLGRLLRCFRKTAANILFFIPKDDEQGYLKYWLNILLCQAFEDPELPPSVEEYKVRPLFSGFARLLICRLRAKHSHLWVSFAYSLSKGSKLAWPQLSDAKRDAALKKHKAALSSRKNYSIGQQAIPQEMEDEILAVSQEIFRGRISGSPTKMCPSSSACLQSSRRNGGALGMLPRVQDVSESVGPVLGKLRTLALNIDLAKTSFLRQAEDGFAADVKRGYVRLFDIEQPESTRPLKFGGKNVGFNDLQIVAIPEPGKFRIISKGNGYLYTALQPLQGEMLNAWKSSVYSSMFLQDLTPRVREIDSRVDGDWMSVDYESATDLLHRRATLLALQGVCDSPQFDLAQYSFSMGMGHYDFSDHKESVLLGEGQPMGHPLSFPLLCVINLAVYRVALRRYAREAKLEQPEKFLEDRWGLVLVNGDDMLFKCPHDGGLFRRIFYETADYVGFRISRGKNYLSSASCMMNSQVLTRSGGKMVRVGYLNQRLTNGINVKKGDGVSAAVPTQLGKDVGKMVHLAPWTSSAVPLCFERFRRDFHAYRPNWYLPVHLGGYGLPIDLAPRDLKITREQRVAAAQFVADPSLALYAIKRAEGETALRVRDLDPLKPTWTFGDWCETYGEHCSSEWLLNVCLWNRFHQIGSEDQEVVVKKIRRDYRLKPMKNEALAKYWRANLRCSTVAPLEIPVPRVYPRSLRSLLGETQIDLPFDLVGAWGDPRRLAPSRQNYRQEREQIQTALRPFLGLTEEDLQFEF